MLPAGALGLLEKGAWYCVPWGGKQAPVVQQLSLLQPEAGLGAGARALWIGLLFTRVLLHSQKRSS